MSGFTNALLVFFIATSPVCFAQQDKEGGQLPAAPKSKPLQAPKLAVGDELSLSFPTNPPPQWKTCATEEVIEVLKTIRIPKPGRASSERYEFYNKAKESRFQRTIRHTPQGPGFEQVTLSQPMDGSDSPTIFRRTGVLAGLIYCYSDQKIVSLQLTGTLFPLRESNRFVVEFSSYGRGQKTMVISCEVRETIPAAKISRPWYPTDGTLTLLACTSTGFDGVVVDSELAFSSAFGRFVPSPPPESENYRME